VHYPPIGYFDDWCPLQQGKIFWSKEDLYINTPGKIISL
jgi:hypothetical protein